jgi:hypothetical protein
MNRRLRFLSALLALVAFSAYFAESVVALSCAPGTEQVAVAAAGAHAGHSTGHDADPESQRSDRSHDSSCPMNVGGATCVAVSLPGATASVQLQPSAADAEFTRDATGAALLLIRTLYHPPRA